MRPEYSCSSYSDCCSLCVCVCVCECRVLSGRGLCDELITRPEESYRLWSLRSAGERAANVKLTFSPNQFCPVDGSSIFIRTLGCTLDQHYECCTLRYSCTATPTLAFMVSYRTNCTFTFNTIPFSAGHCTLCSDSTCAVPGFTSRRAAQVSEITAPCILWSRPLGGSRRGALSEEGTANH